MIDKWFGFFLLLLLVGCSGNDGTPSSVPSSSPSPFSSSSSSSSNTVVLSPSVQISFAGLSNNAEVSSPFDVTANVIPLNGAVVSYVDLLINDVLVRRESLAPYEWFAASDAALGNLAAGPAKLRLQATDTQQKTYTATISVVVKKVEPPVVIEPPVVVDPDNFQLDCGPYGETFLSSGPAKNRVNYIILGDGYTKPQLDTLLMEHVEFGLGKRFNTSLGEPFRRYKNFINVCVLKVASPVSGVCDDRTPFKTCGNDDSRLCSYDRNAVYAAINEYLPSNIEADWIAVVLNNDRWWHAGGFPMCWSGGVGDADGAELHEAGHAFSGLADEYAYDDRSCRTEYPEVNSTADPLGSAGKWDKWVGYNQTGATGVQGFFEGSRYCDSDQYRPSSNSMMRSLFGNNPNTSFNSSSREQIIFSIWSKIDSPYDSTVPAAGNVTNPNSLQVNVIDPAVINVDWSINGKTVKVNGGQTFNIAAQGLSPGLYTIAARAYDNAGEDLVRYRDGTCPPSVTGYACYRPAWRRSSKSVSWTVTIQ
ncbi:MAG: M64 family metallopeptidase [Marinagarivorans sp.]|nr:M64 family metallopeptidase [Marinagarivorans sp.]